MRLAFTVGCVMLLFIPGCGEDAGDSAMAIQVARSIDVMSPAFQNEEMIDAKYTCDGQDISPPLEWAEGPGSTKSYALIMDDPDAPGGTFVHWVAWNIPRTRLPEAVPNSETLPDGTRQGVNSFKKTGYAGPCPPSGTHRYYFKVYALDRTIDHLAPGATKQDLLAAMNGHILAEGETMARYSRTR